MALRRVIRACVGSARLYTAGCRGDAAALALPFGFTAPAAAQQRPVVRAAADSGMRIASWPGFMGSQRAPSHGSAALNGLHGWAGVVPRAAGPLRGILTQQSAAGTAKGKATLVLVESPAKARKIEQYLGPGYQARDQHHGAQHLCTACLCHGASCDTVLEAAAVCINQV